MVCGFAGAGLAKTQIIIQTVTQCERVKTPFQLLIRLKRSNCPPMITHFANNFALTHIDIMSKLIWACKSVRINLRKTTQA